MSQYYRPDRYHDDGVSLMWESPQPQLEPDVLPGEDCPFYYLSTPEQLQPMGLFSSPKKKQVRLAPFAVAPQYMYQEELAQHHHHHYYQHPHEPDYFHPHPHKKKKKHRRPRSPVLPFYGPGRPPEFGWEEYEEEPNHQGHYYPNRYTPGVAPSPEPVHPEPQLYEAQPQPMNAWPVAPPALPVMCTPPMVPLVPLYQPTPGVGLGYVASPPVPVWNLGHQPWGPPPNSPSPAPVPRRPNAHLHSALLPNKTRINMSNPTLSSAVPSWLMEHINDYASEPPLQVLEVKCDAFLETLKIENHLGVTVGQVLESIHARLHEGAASSGGRRGFFDPVRCLDMLHGQHHFTGLHESEHYWVILFD